MANIFQEQVVAQKPKAIAGEQVMVYVPRATNSSAGIATYDPTYFNLVNGKVYLKTNEADRDPTVLPSLIQIQSNGAGGLIYDDGYLKTSLKTINNQSLIKLLDSADGNINLATKSEFDAYKEATDLWIEQVNDARIDADDRIYDRIEGDEVILTDIRDRVAGLAHNRETDDLMYYAHPFIGRSGKILNSALNFDREPEPDSDYLLTSGTIYTQFARLGTAAYVNTGLSSGQVVLLDSNGKLPTSVLPAIAITDTFVANSQAAMLALNAQEGDVCIRTDVSRSYILKATPASVLANWQELLSPTSDPVVSVNNKHGVVVLTSSDIGAVPVESTGDNYFTHIYSEGHGWYLYVKNDPTYGHLADSRFGLETGSFLLRAESEHYEGDPYYHIDILGDGNNGKIVYTKKYYTYEDNDYVEHVIYDRAEIATEVDLALKEDKATIETYTIASNSWTALASSEPFKFSATVTATYTIGNDTEVGIINDQAVLFANYGFIVGSVSGQSVTIYSIAQPDASVSLTVGYRG